MTQRVIVTRRLPAPVETRMRQLFTVTLNADDRPYARADLIEAVRSASVLVPTITDRIDAGVIDAAGPDLGLIASYGNGVDHIDLEAAHARRIRVTNTPGVLTEDTADMTMALILSVPRRLAEGMRVIEASAFPGWSPCWMLGQRVSGKALGIVGLGRVGAAVARRARAFGMAVHYHNRREAAPSVTEPIGATYWPSLDRMLAHMDMVTVHCPRTPETHHLLSARRLEMMAPGAVLVNIARGDIVDEAALIARLEAGALAGAALDVFSSEPAIDPRLIALAKAGRVVLLPHMASATLEARIEMGEKVMINIRTFLDGHRPPDLVLPPTVGIAPAASIAGGKV